MTVLTISFRKTAPKKLFIIGIKKNNADDFKTELKRNLATNSSNYENCKQAFLALLDKHVPYKSKKIRANQVPYVTRNLRKAIC